MSDPDPSAAASGPVVIGFDLGGTKMLSCAYDEGFEVVAQERRKTAPAEGSASVERLIETVRLTVEASGTTELRGIGMACPGPIDVEAGVLLAAPNLGWKDVPLKARLEAEFGCPVRLVNDVDAGMVGESRFGAARGARSALGVFPGTGIGGALVIDGKIFSGPTRTCMEIGHVEVVPEGPLCGCGRRGCLEAVASRLVIASAAARAAYRGEAPYLAANFGTSLRKIKSRALRESIEAGDAAVESIVRAAARAIGVAIGGMVNLLAPEVVVLGGGLVEALPELFLGEVRAAADEKAMDSFGGTYRIEAAELGDDATVLGAAASVD